ncbi:MAG: hypothetical protein H7274_17740 [Rhodoferax sp.]|nr:hypothetical protein [Rhodoferax sp.]
MNSQSAYGQASFDDLKERTQYESWLLEAAYDITGAPIVMDWPDQVIYPANGTTPVLGAFMRGNLILGDWRPQFLEIGAPLVFVTSFKLLDMLIEWVLVQEDQSPPYQFAKKITALKRGVTLPPFLTVRQWLWDRLLGLYERLTPFRNTIIHARYFETSNGTLHVSDLKSSFANSEITLSSQDLRSFAVLAVSLIRYVDGIWQVDHAVKEKHLRRTLDELEHLHGLPTLGQKPPRFLTVRVFTNLTDFIRVDLPRIRRDVIRLCPDDDVAFNLRVVVLESDGGKARAYLFPWNEISEENAPLIRAVKDIAHQKIPLPENIDYHRISQELTADCSGHRIAS